VFVLLIFSLKLAVIPSKSVPKAPPNAPDAATGIDEVNADLAVPALSK
jgi:hypothetical protein